MIQTDKKVHTGSKAAMISTLNLSNDARIIQTVNVKPNTNYTLSGWIATENVQTVNTRQDKDIVGGNLSVMGGWDYAGNIKGTTDWQEVRIDFATKPDQHEIMVGARLGMYFADITGIAYFDDLKLIEKNTISINNTSSGNELKKPGNPIVVVVIFIIVLVTLLLVFIVLFAIRTKKPAEKAEEEIIADTPVNKSEDQSPPMDK
jgi:hypothetical protein